MSKKLDDISLMPLAGWGWCLVGIALIGWGVVFDPTVTSADDYMADRVFNLGQLAVKLMILSAGAFSLLGGATVLLAYGIRKDVRATAGQTKPEDQ